MSKMYNNYGATADGYRGKRAILEQRVIEGFTEAQFTGGVLQLTSTSAKTQHLTKTYTTTGSYIILPKATDLWNNWQVTIINDSDVAVNVYYYTDDISSLNLFKEISAGNMATLILMDDTTDMGTWTTLRTSEVASADTIEKYTSYILDKYTINYNQLMSNNDTEIALSNILAGTSVRSIYIKPTQKFVFDSGSDESDESGTLKVSIGISSDHTKFFNNVDITGSVSNTNFSKDLFEEILNTDSDTLISAYFSGTNTSNLVAGSVDIIVERAKLIDPTVLKNPIIQTSLPIGTVMNYLFDDIPSGYIRLNEEAEIENANAVIPQFVAKLTQANNRLTGEKLIVGIDEWTQIFNQNGSCGKFAWIGSTLKFPAISCFVQGLSSISDLSKLMPAGLPNITGGFNGSMLRDASQYGEYASGAFTLNSGKDYGTPDTGADQYQSGFGFDASRSNSIYGRSTTVQPTSVRYPYILSIYNKVQDSAAIVVDELINQTLNKANTSLSNITSDGREVITNACVPDYANGIIGTMPGFGSWIQVLKNSFVVVDGRDPYMVDARAYVSPDNGVTKYQVGYFFNNINSYTKGTSFTFIVPAGWYFTATFEENNQTYFIYPLKGAQ